MTVNVEIPGELLATILATAPVGVLVLDPRTLRVLLANEQYKRFLDPEWWERDLTGHALGEIIHGFAETKLPHVIQQVAGTGQAIRLGSREYRGFARGATYWSYDAIPLREMTGIGAAVLFTIVEVTEQVVARREVEETNTALAILAEVNATISASLDLDEVMDRVLSAISPLIPYERALVALDDGEDSLRIVAARHQGRQDTPILGTVLPKHGSLNGQVFRDARAILVRDFHSATNRQQEMFFPTSFDPDLHAALCVPLVARGTVIGTFYLASNTVGQYTPNDLRRLELFAPQAASAVANALLHREVIRRATESETLSRVTLTVAASLDLPNVLQHILREIATVVGYDQALVALPDAGGENLRVVSGQGSRFGATVGTMIPMDRSICGVVFAENRPVIIPNLTDAPEWEERERYPHAPRPESDRAVLAVPLVAQAEAVGVLLLVREAVNGYDASDLERLERFAAPIAVAIANARLYAQVRDQVAELRRLNADLEAANRHKSAFLAMMSHELRTPLNAIIGFTELLLNDLIADPNERRRCLDDIFGSGQHLLKIINDVLDIAKIEAGELRLHREAFAVAREIGEAERFMAPLIAQRQQTLTVHLPADLPPVYVDSARVRQIMLNLLSNANKFTPEEGRITVTAEVTGDSMRVCVADTGIGIRPEDAQTIFQEFRQIDGSLARRYGGTGLGLALSKRLIEMQDGTISFQSAPGVGTTFTLTLPCAAPHPQKP